ncbi:hypothetical protein [Oceanobacillus salinisoli]|uniref:hypothetical protein n=1 Tax=Oceanobacillus salinisoli TaxID=2678611 RepID=UPI0012E188AD|nr:hypothetical protein [Oceanobacillus salinisoli]
MNKFLFISIVIMLSSFILVSQSFAIEENSPRLFGIGSSVNQKDSGLYEVKTNGKQMEEGIVFTPKEEFFGGENVHYQVTLKGKGNVILKIEETDPRGKFIHENRSSEIPLKNSWETYYLPVKLSKESTQLDVFVLTSKKEKIDFQMKSINIKKRMP